MASRPVLVRAGDVEFLAEVREAGGPATVGLDEALSFDGVRRTVEAVAQQLGQVWQSVKPDEAVAEFGLSLSAKSGKLTGLLVDGDGAATLKITLTWRRRGNGAA